MTYSTLQDAIHRAMIYDPPEPPHDPPRRIQLRRTKGWRKPEGAIVVARPSKWGNPYKPDMVFGSGHAVGFVATGPGVPDVPAPRVPQDLPGVHWTGLTSYAGWRRLHTTEAHWDCLDDCVALFEQYLGRMSDDVPEIFDEWIDPLRGHDLACWCSADRPPCHADVLIRLANPTPSPVLTVCRTCYGADHCCPVCHGCGWWKG